MASQGGLSLAAALTGASGTCALGRRLRRRPSRRDAPPGRRASALAAFEDEIGAQAPLGFWDPLGLAADGDEAAFKRRRVTEFKHGRVAMCACMGYIEPEYYRLPGYLSPSAGLRFEEVPNGFAAISKVPTIGWLQVVAFIGLVETTFLAYDDARDPGDYKNVGRWGLPLAGGIFDPEENRLSLNRDLANGRLAMVAIMGMFFQDGLTGSAWGDWALYTASPLRAAGGRPGRAQESCGLREGR